MKINLTIEGMTCQNCKKRIEKALLNTNGIETCNVNLTTHKAFIIFNEKMVSLDKIKRTIENLGYKVKKNNLSTILSLSLVIILALSYIFSASKLPIIPAEANYGILLLIGFFTSFHCIGMCGGFNLSQSKNRKNNVIYNLMRIVSYTVMGGIIGGIGQLFSISQTGKTVITVLSGIFMILLSLNILTGYKFKINFKGSSAVVGLLNGLMPCGPLQMMQAYALGTGSMLKGALSMLFFGLGTLPLMLGFGFISSLLNKNNTIKLKKFSSALLLFLGVVMIVRGMSFAGINTNIVQPKIENQSNKLYNERIQKVESNLDSGSYPSISVKNNVPVEWTINVDENKLNGCNKRIIIPEYDLKVDLKPGKNTIKFTPTEQGNYSYSCWMAMIKGNISVI